MLMYIGGMQMTPAPRIRAVAHRRAAGHDAHAARAPSVLQRQRVLVEERPAAVVGRHVDDVAEAEAKQDALLDPGVDAPAGRRRAGSGSAARTVPADSARAKPRERLPRRRPRSAVGAGARRAARSRSAGRSAVTPATACARCSAAAARACDASASTRGRRRHHRQPIDLLEQPHRRHRAFTGIGFDSTKFTCISGSSRVCSRARRRSRRARQLDHLRHLRRDLVRGHRDDAAAADRHQRQRQRIVAREHDEVGRHARADVAHLRHVARRFLHRRRCSGRAPGERGSRHRRCSRSGRARCRARSAADVRRRSRCNAGYSPSCVGLL